MLVLGIFLELEQELYVDANGAEDTTIATATMITIPST